MNVVRCITSPLTNKSSDTALIVCNTPTGALLETLWTNCGITVCADGACDRLSEYFSTRLDEFVPDWICGDLDSVKKSTLEYFSSHRSRIQHVADQDTNDLHKCVLLVESLGYTSVIVYGAFGGRMDQEMGNINVACMFPSVTLVSEENIATVLQAGTTTLEIGIEGPYCGLIPLTFTPDIHTTGLKYNLTGQSMVFGGLVSSSNEIASKTVTISSPNPILWTCTLIPQ